MPRSTLSIGSPTAEAGSRTEESADAERKFGKSALDDRQDRTTGPGDDDASVRKAKKYPCDFPGCGRLFSTATEKTNHYRRHTGDKPYACDQCDKAFVAKGQLRRHMVVHTGEKSFVCEICQKAFNQRSNLKVHMRTHQQNKEFSCSYPGCLVMYKHRWLLREHMMRHPNEEEIEQEIANREAEMLRLQGEIEMLKVFSTLRRDLVSYRDSYYVSKANNMPNQVGRPSSKGQTGTGVQTDSDQSSRPPEEGLVDLSVPPSHTDAERPERDGMRRTRSEERGRETAESEEERNVTGIGQRHEMTSSESSRKRRADDDPLESRRPKH